MSWLSDIFFPKSEEERYAEALRNAQAGMVAMNSPRPTEVPGAASEKKRYSYNDMLLSQAAALGRGVVPQSVRAPFDSSVMREMAMAESDALRAKAGPPDAQKTFAALEQSDVLRALAAQQKLMAADQSRATATAPAQRRSYPIDVYGSTPEERIRNVQRLNAAEAQGPQEFIMEEAPSPDPLLSMLNYGVPTYSPQEVDIFRSRPRYEFSPDTGPDQTNADANMRRATADESHVKYLRDELAAQQKMMPEFSLMELLKAKAQFEKSGIQNSDLDSMINIRLQQQRIEEERQNQLRQRQRTQSFLPITGRPMTSLAEMIQHGFIA